ncbi:MAG: B12-binding domain-containing radical SAM protein [Deltaproteobacteria bacterium]|nr:B12-binding domain-containing radical SAM protein [Deltaproteobacteria bacterium]
MPASVASGHGKVLLIELVPSVPNLGRFIVMPRYGLLAIASVLADRTDYDVKLLFEPYVGKLDAEAVEREEPRYILINGLTTSAHDNERFVGSVRDRLGSAVPVIAGGEHATMFPEDAKRYADYILAYEGDDTVVPLLSALEEEDPLTRDSLLSQVPGLHYRDLSGTWRFNREPARVERIDYRYDFSVVPGSESAARRFRTAHIPLQTSRGCKFCCSFCSWISLYGRSGYLVRPVEDVLHDILHTIEYTGVRNFMVCDNLFGGDAAYTEELMHGVIRAFEGRADKPLFTVLCRADQFAGGPGSLPEKTVKVMARGGVSAVSLGLESISTRSLIQMRKRSDLQQYYAAAETLRRNGIGMLATFVAGFDGDNYEDVVNIAEFGERLGLFTVQVYARNITPGTIDDFLSEKRAIPGVLHKYRNGHGVHILPAMMLPSELQRAIFEAAFRFHSGDGMNKKVALRAFHAIWNAFNPHHEGLLRLEREILIPEGIYKRSGSGFLLDVNALDVLTDGEDRFRSFARKSEGIFLEADRMTPVRRIPVPEAAAIA